MEKKFETFSHLILDNARNCSEHVCMYNLLKLQVLLLFLPIGKETEARGSSITEGY